MGRGPVTVSVTVRPLLPGDHDQLFAAFGEIVDALEGFPHAPPLSRTQFDDYWLAHTTGVWMAVEDDALVRLARAHRQAAE